MIENKEQLMENIKFINISNEEGDIFHWRPPNLYTSFKLDLNIVRQYATDDIFFHIDKGNVKIVHTKKKALIYTIGATIDLQFQLLEAILEYIHNKFNEMFDYEVIASYGPITTAAFKNFKNIIEDMLSDFDKLKLIKKINIYCRVCQKTIPLIIKNSFIETAESFPAPLVYIHEGHAVLAHIDKNFDVRGEELVNITG